MIQIYHNNRCGKSREALKVIEQSGKPYCVIKYLENPLDSDAIKIVLKQLNFKPIELVRQKEKLWIENFRVENYTDNKIIKTLANNPILIQRPIVLNNDIAIVAHDLEKLNDFI